MRKAREINFYKVIMIAIIISFSFLFAGVIGLNVEVKDVNNSFTTTSVSEGEGEKEITYLNWVESDENRNDYPTQTDVIPSTSLTIVNGYYQINSINDWLYALYIPELSTEYSYPKFELNCDIELNDGYFDENGNYVDEEDGKLYVSTPFRTGKDITIKGNGHTIKGFYIDESLTPEEVHTEKGGRSLAIFMPKRGTTISDLYVENIYINSPTRGWIEGSPHVAACGICLSGTITNVHILSGEIRSEEYSVTGFIYNGTLKNCTNKANVYSGNGTAVGFALLDGETTNCINYGNITGKNAVGIRNNGTINNCKNYGKIVAVGETATGIGTGTMTDCQNYGEVQATGNASGISMGYNPLNCKVYNCTNYGKISSDSGIAAGVGYAYPRMENCINYGDVFSKSKVAVGVSFGTGNPGVKISSIKYCKNYGKVTSETGTAIGINSDYTRILYNCVNYGDLTGKHVAGIDGSNATFMIDSCKNYGTLYCKGGNIGGITIPWNLRYATYAGGDLIFKNCVIDCTMLGTATTAGALVAHTEGMTMMLFDRCTAIINDKMSSDLGFIAGNTRAYSTAIPNIVVKDSYIKVNADNNGTNYVVVKNQAGSVTTKGVVIKETGYASSIYLTSGVITSGKENFESLIIDKPKYKYVYGTNLEPYSYKWKTGEIGLKALDNSLFQGEVTEDYLKSKGFQGEYFMPDILDDEYIKLAYIESTGAQYVVLDYKANQNTRIEWDMEFVENGNTNASGVNNAFIGRDGVLGEQIFGVNFGGNSNQDKQIFWWTDRSYGNSGVTTYGHTYTNVLGRTNLIVQSGSCTFQDVTKACGTKTGTNLDNLVLMGTFSNGSMLAFNRYNLRTYSIKIYEGGILVLSLSPAKSFDGETCLYDKVEGKFYKNAGSGNFVAGDVVY